MESPDRLHTSEGDFSGRQVAEGPRQRSSSSVNRWCGRPGVSVREESSAETDFHRCFTIHERPRQATEIQWPDFQFDRALSPLHECKAKIWWKWPEREGQPGYSDDLICEIKVFEHTRAPWKCQTCPLRPSVSSFGLIGFFSAYPACQWVDASKKIRNNHKQKSFMEYSWSRGIRTSWINTYL